LTHVVRRRFDIVMNFSAWPAHRDPSAFLAEAARKRLVPMLTWEPWQALAASGPHRRVTRRTGVYHAIATGRYDGYIRMYAHACARYRGVILLRYAPGMNDRWYPLPSPARAYVAAWRHVVGTFRAAGAANVVFVFSVNPSLYIRSPRAWLRSVRTYWPGTAFVTWVGATMIDFGGARETSVKRLASRVALLRGFGKPVMVTEANVNYRMRYRWMQSVRKWLASAPWVRAVVWSQAQAPAHLPGMGNMDWKLVRDPRAARLLGSMIASRDVRNAPARVSWLLPSRLTSATESRLPGR